HAKPWQPVREIVTDAVVDLFAQRSGRIAQHRVLGGEVVLHQPLGNACLGSDLAQAHPFQPAIGRYPPDRGGDEPSAFLMVDALGHATHPFRNTIGLQKSARAFIVRSYRQKEDPWGSVDSSRRRRATSTSRRTSRRSPPCRLSLSGSTSRRRSGRLRCTDSARPDHRRWCSCTDGPAPP